MSIRIDNVFFTYKKAMIIELSLIALLLSGGIFCSVVGSNYGIIGVFLGAIIGAFLGWLLHVFIWKIIFLSFKQKKRSTYPICKNGLCHSSDYKYICFTYNISEAEKILQHEHGGLIVKCNCGDKYLFIKKQKKFMEILPTGILRPYMKYRAFKDWELDNS